MTRAPFAVRARSEYGRIRRVLVHTPGRERLALQTWAPPGQEPPAVAQLSEIQEEHARIKAELIDALGGEAVLELTSLLEAMFDAGAARRATILSEILGGAAPSFCAELEASAGSISAVDPAAIVASLVASSPSLLWVRDPAVNTPAGIVVHEMTQAHRRREPALLRAILRHHPMFGAGSLFDDLTDGTGRHAAELPVDWNLLDGGNIIVLGPGALAIGVPDLGACDLALEGWIRRLLLAETTPRIASVYLVTVPAPFGHLDAVFNLFAPGTAVAMPYLLGGPAALSPAEVRRGLRLYKSAAIARGSADPRPDRLSARGFDGSGQVELFSSNSAAGGQIVRRRLPGAFLDQLAADGWIAPGRIAWIGGNPEEHESPAVHMANALHEQSQQAGNLLALAPCDVMMSDHNPRTRGSIERLLARTDHSFRVRAVSMPALAACYGGLRCLTLPLLRDDA